MRAPASATLAAVPPPLALLLLAGGRSADSPPAWRAAPCAKKGMKDTGARGTSDEIINLV